MVIALGSGQPRLVLALNGAVVNYFLVPSSTGLNSTGLADWPVSVGLFDGFVRGALSLGLFDAPIRCAYSMGLFDGPGRVGAPLGPGARVKTAGAPTGQLEGQQVMAGGDARPAVHHRGTPGVDAEIPVYRPQCLRRLEAPRFVQVAGRRCIDCARDMAGSGIDRLDLAPVPLGRAGIEHDGGGRNLLGTGQTAGRPLSDLEMARAASGPVSGRLIYERTALERAGHASTPPSRSDAGWPVTRRSHTRRAAIRPPSSS